jgi:hypothetical protein
LRELKIASWRESFFPFVIDSRPKVNLFWQVFGGWFAVQRSVKIEKKNTLVFVIFLTLAAGWATWAAIIRMRAADRGIDPGFANYSLLADAATSTDLEINAAREAENINAGTFHPYIAGKSNDSDASTQEIDTKSLRR